MKERPAGTKIVSSELTLADRRRVVVYLNGKRERYCTHAAAGELGHVIALQGREEKDPVTGTMKFRPAVKDGGILSERLDGRVRVFFLDTLDEIVPDEMPGPGAE